MEITLYKQFIFICLNFVTYSFSVQRIYVWNSYLVNDMHVAGKCNFSKYKKMWKMNWNPCILHSFFSLNVYFHITNTGVINYRYLNWCEAKTFLSITYMAILCYAVKNMFIWTSQIIDIEFDFSFAESVHLVSYMVCCFAQLQAHILVHCSCIFHLPTKKLLL